MMKEQNTQINWPVLILIIFFSSSLAFTIDVLVGYSNYTFLISWFLPIILSMCFYKHLVVKGKIDAKKIKNDRQTNREKFEIWRYEAWSYVGFYLMSTGLWAAIKNIISEINYVALNYDEWYISIVLTTILVTIYGDWLLYWWFRMQGITRIFQYKEHLINQNNVRVYIYLAYFIILLASFSGWEYESTQLWKNTFVTYVAFERFWSNRKLWNNKEFSI